MIALIYVVWLSVVFWIMKKGQQWRAETNRKRREREAEAAAQQEHDLEKQCSTDRHSIQENDFEGKSDR